jgi:aminopeptidase N
MGETAFDRAVRQHLQVHASAGTTTDDLVRSFVDVGGPVAQRILDEWLETTTWTTRLRQSVSLDELFASYRRSSGGGA